MARETIEKTLFYDELVKMMGRARGSVHFYSVSCCFGFYSRGLANFERVLLAIKAAVNKRQRGQYLDVRVLVKIDHDNPIDLYAAERLAELENRAPTEDADGDRNVFRELTSDMKDSRAVQILILDSTEILVSEVQDEEYNDTLDLVLNRSARGEKFEKDDAPEEVQGYQAMFEEVWKKASRLNVEIRQVSRRRLRYEIEQYKCIQAATNERDLHLLLTGYLHGLFGPAIVDREVTVGRTRIDLVVGVAPQHKRLGIEVKYQPDDGAIHEIVGQIRHYRKEYESVVLVVGRPKYSPQRRQDLLTELTDIDVALIELE